MAIEPFVYTCPATLIDGSVRSERARERERERERDRIVGCTNQNRWPHGVMTGSSAVSKQMLHSNMASPSSVAPLDDDEDEDEEEDDDEDEDDSDAVVVVVAGGADVDGEGYTKEYSVEEVRGAAAWMAAASAAAPSTSASNARPSLGGFSISNGSVRPGSISASIVREPSMLLNEAE